MNSKKVRILAYVGLGFMAVFTVSLILFFTDMSNTVYMTLTLVSGFIGVGLYLIVRVMMRERKYLQDESGAEPGEKPEEAKGNNENAESTKPLKSEEETEKRNQ